MTTHHRSAVRLLMPWLLATALAAGDQPAAPPSPGTVALTALTVPDLTAAAIGVLHQDGSADPGDLSELLTQINRAVSGRLAFAPDRGGEGDAASGDAPLGAGAPWRLWAFWAVDVPACNGLAAALTAVRASGLAQVRPVHLCGLAAWDAWMGRMDGQRGLLGERARAQDQPGCDRVSAAWRAAVAPFDAMLSGFYRRGVHLISDTGAAIALHVDQVPCFRLVSPRHRIHALEGFEAGEDVAAWVSACQAWEAERDGGPPPAAPARLGSAP